MGLNIIKTVNDLCWSVLFHVYSDTVHNSRLPRGAMHHLGLWEPLATVSEVLERLWCAQSISPMMIYGRGIHGTF